MTPTWTPPGHVSDLDAIDGGRAAWDFAVSRFFVEAAFQARLELPAGSSAQFVDALHNGAALEWTPAPIVWNGFPKALLAKNATLEKALIAADSLVPSKVNGRSIKVRPQDEYLEWHATRDDDGRILAVDFTCEGPEYWQAIAHGYPDVVVPTLDAPAAHGDLAVVTALYQEFVNPAVKEDELTDANGSYDPWNVWNTERGAMHLTHAANSLQNEVLLAGRATVLRQRNGVILTDADQLIGCAKYGDPRRASDPTIGGAVNGLARSGALVSLLDPVGIYIDSLDTTGWAKPDGSPVGDYWTVKRGSPGLVLRARYEVPREEGFVVSDIKIGGENILHAGQIARKITMRLTGIWAEKNQHGAPAAGCAG